jgi:ATP phosphoribosyltransferase regulatory subunit HisZ
MDRIKALIDRILDRSSSLRQDVDAEIVKLPAVSLGSNAVARAVEDINKTMDTALIVARHIDSLNDLVDELQREIHLLRNSL